MMAAARILIWLPVREVRRSSISNMAFPLGACSFLKRASRLRIASSARLSCRCGERQARPNAGHVCVPTTEGVLPCTNLDRETPACALDLFNILQLTFLVMAKD